MDHTVYRLRDTKRLDFVGDLDQTRIQEFVHVFVNIAKYGITDRCALITLTCNRLVSRDKRRSLVNIVSRV